MINWMIRHKQLKIASKSRMSRASPVIGTAVCMVYNVFITDSWTGIDLRLEHDLGVKEVWEKHVSKKMFRFQGLTLKINITGECVCSFLVIFYQPFPQWEGQKERLCFWTACISPTGFTQDQIKVLSCWPELEACVKRLKIAVSVLLRVYFLFFLSGWLLFRLFQNILQHRVLLS